MSAQFPDVPDVPGVPQVARNESNSVGDDGNTATGGDATLSSDDAGDLDTQQTGDAAGVLSMSPQYFGGQWGIFTPDGIPALVADTVLSIDMRKDWKVSTFPLEQGDFSSYNKVENPYDGKLTLAIGGTLEQRTDFLTLCAQLCGDLNMYMVCMPEIAYANANLMHFDFSRTTRSGQTMLTVTIYVNEIRIGAASAFSNTAQPSGADPTVDGTVQSTTPSSSQTTDVTNAVPGASPYVPGGATGNTTIPPAYTSTNLEGEQSSTSATTYTSTNLEGEQGGGTTIPAANTVPPVVTPYVPQVEEQPYAGQYTTPSFDGNGI